MYEKEKESHHFNREVGVVRTWWSGLNREVVSLGRVEIAGIGAVGTWWSGLNREVVSL